MIKKQLKHVEETSPILPSDSQFFVNKCPSDYYM